MTTDATIQAHKRRFIDKLIERLKNVDIIVNSRVDYDLFTLYGTDSEGIRDSGLIMAPGGVFAWTVPHLLDLLAKIEEYGRQTPYHLTLRKQNNGSISMWKTDVMVPAGRIPMDFAYSQAERYGAEVFEFMRDES